MELTHRVVLTTAPDAAVAERLAKGLVEANLAACVNVVPGVTSIYRWQGKIERDAELLLVCKTTAANVEKIAAWLKTNHPYELPETLALPVISGGPEYLRWLAENVA